MQVCVIYIISDLDVVAFWDQHAVLNSIGVLQTDGGIIPIPSQFTTPC